MNDFTIVAFPQNPKLNETIELKHWPHITLKRRFKLRNAAKEEIIDILTNTSSQLQSTLVTFSQPKTFQKGPDQVVTYVSPIPGDVFIKSHQGILNVLKEMVVTRDSHFEGENFKPHLTINHGNAGATDLAIPKGFNFASFTLMEEVDSSHDQWQVVHIFNFNE